MAFWTMLMVTVHEGTAEDAAKAHIKRRAIDEAAETVAGFRDGENLLATDDPNLMCVLCVWEDEASYEEWLKSPVRERQTVDLAGMMSSADIKSLSFRSVHSVKKPQ